MGEASGLEQQDLGEIVVVADDDPAVRDILLKSLSRDFQVHMAKDGNEALACLETTTPVAILTDEMMPGATGTDVLESAKARHPDAVRVLMTANTDFRHAVASVNRGEIDRFFSKPLRPVEVRRVLLDLVERQRSQALLRVELDALRSASGEPVQTDVRVLALGVDERALAPLQAVASERGWTLVVEPGGDNKHEMALQRSADVVCIGVDDDDELRGSAWPLKSVDETLALVYCAPEPSLRHAMAAHELGVDYVAGDLDATGWGNRLERAVADRQTARDHRRITADLIVSNRDLAAARRHIEDDQIKALNAMIRTLEARDPYTAGHTDRVAALSQRIAAELGLSGDELDRIRRGALVHDLGKIGVRDDVLLKPGKLSAEEYDHIKEHPAIGHRLLKGIEAFEDVLPIVRSHHEKIDGGGYPDGLSGDQISIEVRVVAVADVLDAITSTRPYRPGSSLEKALAIIDKMTGPHLDPDVVAALKKLHAEGRIAPLLHNAGAGDAVSA